MVRSCKLLFYTILESMKFISDALNSDMHALTQNIAKRMSTHCDYPNSLETLMSNRFLLDQHNLTFLSLSWSENFPTQNPMYVRSLT